MTASPNFFVPGAMKSATSTLYQILRQHEEIFLPREKDSERLIRPEVTDLGRYSYERWLFGKCFGKKVVGDVSAGYMFYPHFPALVHEWYGESTKFVFCLRNPVDRAVSHYRMAVRQMHEDKVFHDAVDAEKARCERHPSWIGQFGYVGCGLYDQHLEPFFRYFKRDNMFFIIFEDDFLLDRKKTIEKLFEFLGVDPYVKVNLEISAGLPKRDTTVTYYEPGQFRDSRRGVRSLDKVPLLGRVLRKATALKVNSSVACYSEGGKVRLFENPDSELRRRLDLIAESGKFSLNKDERCKLFNTKFAQSIERTEKLIGRDLGIWRNVFQ